MSGSTSAEIRVAVFIDWHNTYRTAREAFGWVDYPGELGNYSPFRLARSLAAGNGRGELGKLVRVNVHRGLPSSKQDSVGYAAVRRQSAAWMNESPELVIPRLRPLRYQSDGEAREKGVDVELALAAAEWVISEQCDVAIVFSHDTDLVPLVEMVCRLKSPSCLETVSWVAPGFSQRIRTKPPVYHHTLSDMELAMVEDHTNYAVPSERR